MSETKLQMCKYCLLGFADEVTLKTHTIREHLLYESITNPFQRLLQEHNEENVQQDVNVDNCVCGGICKITESLEPYLKSIVKRTDFVCGFCIRSFSSKYNLDKHIKLHLQKRNECLQSNRTSSENIVTSTREDVKESHSENSPRDIGIQFKWFRSKEAVEWCGRLWGVAVIKRGENVNSFHVLLNITIKFKVTWMILSYIEEFSCIMWVFFFLFFPALLNCSSRSDCYSCFIQITLTNNDYD